MSRTSSVHAPRHCDISVRRRPATTVITVAGDLDWRTAPDLRRATEVVPTDGRLLLDLRRVREFDSAATAAVIDAFVKCRDKGTSLAVAVSDADIVSVLDYVGLDSRAIILTDELEVGEWLRDPE